MWQFKNWYEKEYKDEWKSFENRVKKNAFLYGFSLFLMIITLVAAFPFINNYNAWGITCVVFVTASLILDIPIFLVLGLAMVLTGIVFLVSIFYAQFYSLKILIDYVFILLLSTFGLMLKHSIRKK